MQADEATEFMDKDRETDQFKQRAAMLIAFLAMVLAITGLGGSNAGKDALNNNILASNYFSFYQAKNLRQATLIQQADEIELGWLADPALSESAKTALRAKVDQYRKTIARYESEPDTGEGKKELLAKAKEHEAERDIAMRKDPYFDYAEALLQIAIVLVSVAIIADLGWLMALGGLLGALGVLLTINGYLLLVAVPGLG